MMPFPQSTIEIAVEYARAGLSVFPVDMRLNPDGSHVKKAPYGYLWLDRATSVVAVVESDFRRAVDVDGIPDSELGIGWACGKDGRIALDFDGQLPDWHRTLGSTLTNVTKRGHHLIFRFPPGQRPGNSTARFPSQGWGEARGAGGYIIIAGPDRPGLPLPLDDIEPFPFPSWLTDAGASQVSVTSSAASAWIAAHAQDDAGDMDSRLRGYVTRLDEWTGTQSRHERALEVACWAMREAAAGLVPAQAAADLIADWWQSVSRAPGRGRALDVSELRSIIRTAIGYADGDPVRVASIRAAGLARAVDAQAAGESGPSPAAEGESAGESVSELNIGDPLDDPMERAILRGLLERRIRAAVDARWRVETQPPPAPRDTGTLREILARPPAPPHRIEGIWVAEANMVLSAQRKTGKTTMALNIVRSLQTGDPWLGRPVRKLDGRVAFLNYEVSSHLIAQWADEHAVDVDGLMIESLRGRPNPLIDPAARAELAADLRAFDTELLIVDPLTRAFTGDNQNDATQMQLFLSDLEMFARNEAGATDLMLTAHAGWDGERTRGSSETEGWTDVTVYLTRDAEDQSLRFVRTDGRGGDDIAEERLDYDPATRTLSLSGLGNRRQQQAHRLTAQYGGDILLSVAQTPGLTQNGILDALTAAGVTFKKQAAQDVIKQLVGRGDLVVRNGPRNSRIHYLPSQLQQPPSTSTGPATIPGIP